MLKEMMSFLADELNNYLVQKGEVVSSTDSPRVVLGNVARAFDSDTPPIGADPIVNNAILSIVNVEEDRVAKQQENYYKKDTTVEYKSPPLYLNVYVMVAVNRNNYGTSLTWLSHILRYFQNQHVFTPITNPALDSRIQELIVDLYSTNFEQINHIWGVLGGKYLPSVVYKVRQLTLDEDMVLSEAGFIRQIRLNEKTKQAISS